MPVRIQRERIRGWQMTPNSRYVGRPGPVGNPFRIGYEATDNNDAVAFFLNWLKDRPELVERARRDLEGFDLVCWCPLDRACHADVWLRLANPTTEEL